jgi:hypothetical protein
MWYIKTIYCVYKTVIHNICKFKDGTETVLVIVKHFTTKTDFACIDGASWSKPFLLNYLHLLL